MNESFCVTFFDDEAAATKRELNCSLDYLADLIRRASATKKDRLPWLKLAVFGDTPSPKNSLRHNDNVVAITGVEGDYDGVLMNGSEAVSFDAAVAIVAEASLCAMLYTSPSHSPAKPRWRIVCPTSQEMPPERRDDLIGRLNNLFGGALSSESWTLSQSYYYGAVNGNQVHHRVEIIDGDFIDLRSDLGWRAKKNNGNARPDGAAPGLDLGAAISAVVNGTDSHPAVLQLIGRWWRDGKTREETKRLLIEIFERRPQERRDGGWRAMVEDVDRSIAGIYDKEADKKEKRAAEFAKAEKLSDADVAFVAAQGALGKVEYERGRSAAAKQLRVSVRTLDKLVEAYREATEPAAPSQSTQADALLGIAAQAQLFHNAEGIAYADITVNGHRETWPVATKGFRDWLTREYFKLTQGVPSGYGMDAALGLVEARARFDAPTQEVFLRTARVGDTIYLDLCDDAWRAIEIDKSGWRVVPVPTARFRRARGMLPLPVPEKGGSVNDLRQFLNVTDDEDFVLAVGWELGALSGVGPYPVLAIGGEHGAAKTFFGRVLRALIDPNKVPQRAFPRHDHDLYVAGGNALVLAFDNISTLPDWLSDTLCRLSTGGGFATRELYSDAEEKLFDGMRPLILNGIEDFIVRPDLGDRTIALILEKISGEKRRTETALWDEFEKARPKILGALFDVLVHGLRELANTSLAELPRMADFALWVAACEQALWEQGTFEKAYEANRLGGQIALLDTDIVAVAMRKLAARPPRSGNESDLDYQTRITNPGTMWEGTASDLLEHISAYASEETRRDRRWPRTARKLGGRLRRMAPALRRVGVEIGFERGHESKITVTRTAKQEIELPL